MTKMKINEKILGLLSIVLVCSCQSRPHEKPDITFIYTWTDSFYESQTSGKLTLEDSIIRFYPQIDNPDIVAFGILRPEVLDSIESIIAGLNAEECSGFFSVGKIKVEYEVTKTTQTTNSQYHHPRQLNLFLLEQVAPLRPYELAETFDSASNYTHVYNNGEWNELKLIVLQPNTKKCLQRLTINSDSILYQNFENRLFERSRALEGADRDSLTKLVSEINLQYFGKF